ncbi:hypothetical protein DFH07DRAFT_855037 [Mycena maculata]|uniref:Uncharacterized protein n=1 Tax=Mycena maculata TaxID=230809 RepID=A0AAD7MMF7_9AGAR|nr:hypothetical protein DFH07DRAFT_855037 [Mycena maculata]
MRCALLTLAFAGSAWAAPRLPKRDWTGSDITLNGPTGNSGQTFEQTVDNGKSWSDDARNMPLGAPSSVGFRLTGQSQTAVIVQNSVNGTHGVWYHSPRDPYNFGLSNNDITVVVNYSAPAKAGIKAGELYHIPIVGHVEVNADPCDGFQDATFNSTVYGKDGHATFHGSGDLAIDFIVNDLLKVQNITFPVAGGYIATTDTFLFAQYDDPASGPLVTAYMNIFGGFCDVDD